MVSSKPLSFQHSSTQDMVFDVSYTMASYLTDPLCTAHRWYRQLGITDDLYAQASRVEIIVRKGCFLIGTVTSGILSTVTAPLGALLRFVLNCLQDHPFLHLSGKAREKEIPETISLLSWNLCCVPGGYSITDGGVIHWSFRTQQMVTNIKNQDADVVCLYEIFDIQTAHCLIEGLKDNYANFYCNIGPNAMGPSSGLFVASKFRVAEPKFIPFPKEDLDGRARFCNKGVFSFDLARQDGGCAARIFSTHLQHSETPCWPTIQEMEAREREMALIISEMRKVHDKTVIITGDLNTDDHEYKKSKWGSEPLNKGICQTYELTWGGDLFCATLSGKVASPPLNLDYCMVFDDPTVMIMTSLIDTGFVAKYFLPQALSDHKGLFSLIKLPKK